MSPILPSASAVGIPMGPLGRTFVKITNKTTTKTIDNSLKKNKPAQALSKPDSPDPDSPDSYRDRDYRDREGAATAMNFQKLYFSAKGLAFNTNAVIQSKKHLERSEQKYNFE